MKKRDIKGDILRYHKERWRERFHRAMQVNHAKALKLISLLLKGGNSETQVLEGIEELFEMYDEGLLGDAAPDVGQLSYQWNRITARLEKNDWSKYQTKA